MSEERLPHDDTMWFLAGARGEKAGPRLVSLCEEMAMQQATIIANTDKCISVFQYGGGALDTNPEEHFPIDVETLSYNAAQNAVETVHAKIVKNKIALMPLTNGGGYLARHRAKDMGKAVEGVFDDNDGERIEEDVIMDALVTDHGAGAIMVREGRDRCVLEHIAVEDVWWDEVETRMGKPTCCYYVPRDGLDVYKVLEMLANPEDEGMPGFVGTVEERRKAILSASQKPQAWRLRKTTKTTHRVDIFEAWHPPTYREECEEDEDYEEEGETKSRKVKRVKHDGRHVIAVAGEEGTLVDEPWDEKEWPILLYVPRRRRRHVLGLSLMRSLLAPQREYEKGTAKIQHMHQKMGVSGWAASKQADINVREITSGTKAAGFVVEFEGQMAPIPLTPEPVPQGTYAYVDNIPRQMLERNGISSLAASSSLPAGLQQASGKALQVFEDFEDVRLLPYHRSRERFRVALGWLIICCCKRIVERTGSYKARYRGKMGVEEIDWKELLDLIKDRESFVLKVFPVSQLSKQPAARFAQLTELLNAGAINVEQFKRLFDLPDLEAENMLDTADTDIIDRNLDIMVTKGKYVAPDSFDNLELLVQRTGKFINVCRQHDVPESRIKLLHDHIEDAKSLMEEMKAKEAARAAEAQAKAQAAAAANGAPPGGMPPPGGAPPPGAPPPPQPGPPMGMAA